MMFRFALFCVSFTLFLQSAMAQDPNHITHGPILGRLSSHGIGIWARTYRAGEFQVRWGLAPDQLTEARMVPTALENDNTGWVHITGLKPNTRYFYQLYSPGTETPAGRGGSFRTLPDTEALVDPELNPAGLFNFSFEFACGNNQNPDQGLGPSLPTFRTMLERLDDKIHFAILNGDWLYEVRRGYTTDEWQSQVGTAGQSLPKLIQDAPTIVGVWENYKHFLDQGTNLRQWHAEVPSFFMYDDHECLNDIWGAGSPGLRDRRAVFRDIGVRAWYDYLAWSNPTEFNSRTHISKAEFKKGSDVLFDPRTDFTALDPRDHNNLHVHWGTATAGVNDNDLDGVGGVPNAGVYAVKEVLDKHHLRIAPPAVADGTDSYSIGRRNYYKLNFANCDIFLLDTRGQRQMHDTKDPSKKGLSHLGKQQREWLETGLRESKADFLFVVSSVNFMIPHVGGGKVRATNKDDAWTVFYDEREALIEMFDQLDKPVMLLTGDLHNSFVIQITDNVFEMASGPHNSQNHLASDEGDRPANGPFQYGPRAVDIRWSTYFLSDIPRSELKHPTYCVVQVNNVFNNALTKGQDRWVAFPRPHVIFQYYSGLTGDLLYAETIHARR